MEKLFRDLIRYDDPMSGGDWFDRVKVAQDLTDDTSKSSVEQNRQQQFLVVRRGGNGLNSLHMCKWSKHD